MVLKKPARIFLFVTGFLVVIAICLSAFVHFYGGNRLKQYLEKQVAEKSAGKYRLSIRRCELSLIAGNVSLHDAELNPVNQDTSKMNVHAQAKTIDLKGIAIYALLKKKELIASELGFEDLAVRITAGKRKQKKDTSAHFSLYQMIHPGLNKIAISAIQLSTAKLELMRYNDSLPEFSTGDNNFVIKNLIISQRTDSLQQLFFADEFVIQIKKFEYRPANDQYTLAGKNLFIDQNRHDITIDSFALIPNYKKGVFEVKAGHQVSRVVLKTALKLIDLDREAFIQTGSILARKAIIDGLDLEVYRNRNMPFRRTEKPSIQRLIRNIPIPLKIDTVQVKNGIVNVEILSEGAKEPGRLFFNKIEGDIHDLSNDTNAYTTKSALQVIAKAMVVGVGQAEVNYNFPLTTDKEVFTCSGKLASMDLKELNGILTKTARLSIVSGRLEKMRFNFEANEKNSYGELEMGYRDLEVELLNDEGKAKGFGTKLKSLIASNFIIYHNNPEKNKAIRVKEIKYSRNPYRYFLYYTWQSLLSGIMPTIGLQPSMLPGTR